MLKTNVDRLVQISVMGEIAHPASKQSPYRISTEGEPTVMTGSAGITYNVRVGDSATHWLADHVEPAVSIKHPQGDGVSGPNGGLNVLACMGNRAQVVSGKAEGRTGIVTGKHGGAERVMVDFTPEIMEELVLGDKIMVRAWGVGLALTDYQDVKIFNTSPCLLDAWGIEEGDGMLHVPVARLVPAAVMGSGLGVDNLQRGDYDITMFDEQVVKEYELDSLRLGDFVAIMDADHSYGPIYRQGAVSIGIIIHGNSIVAGHGPGVTSLMTSRSGNIKPVMDTKANLATVLALRDDI